MKIVVLDGYTANPGDLSWEALDALGEVEAWPILVASQVTDPGEYTVSVRASVRRGRLTDALRTLMFWSDDWQRESEWYSWSLPR